MVKITPLFKIGFILFAGGLIGILLFNQNWSYQLAYLMISASMISFAFWGVECLIFTKPIEDSKLKSNKYEKRAERTILERGIW